jgi:hypothetical protein
MSTEQLEDLESLKDQFDRWTIAKREAIQEKEILREKLDICDRMLCTIKDRQNRIKAEGVL